MTRAPLTPEAPKRIWLHPSDIKAAAFDDWNPKLVGYVRADLPQPAPAPGWRVRALEWRHGLARTRIGAYEVLDVDGSWRLYFGRHPDHMTWIGQSHETEDAAQAAAQVDIAARIAACIETLPAPPGSPSPAPEERARILMEMVQADWDAGLFDLTAPQEPSDE